MSALAHDQRHAVQWVTAAPLWRSVLAAEQPTPQDAARMRRPAILRFESDSFMTDLAEILDDDPATLGQHEATRRSFRGLPPGRAPGSRSSIDHLKLYQPAHGHFNLVAATLTCRIRGLPDKAVEQELGDQVGFVLRRLAASGELAWVAAAGSSGSPRWVTADTDELTENEDVLPLFPVVFGDTADRRRRLLLGLIPTSSTQSTKNSGIASLSPPPVSAGGPVQPDARLAALDERVIRPLKALSDDRMKSLGQPAPLAQAMKEGRFEASRFLLLDLADLLSTYVPTLWNGLLGGQRPQTATDFQPLYDVLDQSSAETGSGWSWRGALGRAWNDREGIWGEQQGVQLLDLDLGDTGLNLTAFGTAAATAFKAVGSAPAAPQPGFDAPKLDPRSSVRYVVRCVYRRPRCACCAPDVLSEPTEEFAIAPFFDVDAPARPIQIGLPIDTSIAGLRKSPKSVAFVISKELRQQMTRASNMKKLIASELEEGEQVDFGTICAFSIPIITICALILLMVIVSLLNIVFWWLPFFRICFPIGLKAGD